MSDAPSMGLANLPPSIRLALGMIGGGGGAFLTHHFFGMTGMAVFLIGIMAVGLLLLAYVLILKGLQGRRAAHFAESMQSQASSAPSSLSKAEQIAKLDDLRKKFEEGVETFRRAGKDFYSLPWYLLIGESGSGKTEAMRRSGVGFPPGVQDYLQGVGGTINMHWWFTNQAVVLDLAGRVVFGEVASGATSEWETFLKLLKKNRPLCPINGLLLVIPAKSMIRDSSEEMVKKAQRISEQINRVQRILDIRFPVFVMVTMCDLVTGFREFFEPLRGSEEQQQMLGWSNSQPIDVPFRTEMTEQYLNTVVERLSRRRQLMLRDPAPQRDLSDSRLDEVDALFKLPDAFAQLAGTLKLYLQTIFVPTEWAAKPPFLRGIYFTSSMQEGAALDLELAKALGMSVDKLPSDGIWKRERALFLRDLFIEKVFHEKGLVTSASNVQRQYRRRKIALLTTSAAAACFLLFLTWFGWRNLERRIGRERNLWRYVAEEFDRKTSLAVVAASERDPKTFDYKGGATMRLPQGQQTTLAELHANLFASVQSPLDVPGIFRLTRPFDTGFDAKRCDAMRVIFETDILKPAVDCAAARLSQKDEAWSPAATAALGSLIRLRADACGTADRKPKPEDLDNLLTYALEGAGTSLTKNERQVYGGLLDWCYHDTGGQTVSWPPAWLRQDLALVSNSAVAKGVARFIENGLGKAGDLSPQLADVQRLSDDLQKARADSVRQCGASEAALLAVMEKNRELLQSRIQEYDSVKPLWDAKAKTFADDVSAAAEQLKTLRKRREAIPLCAGTSVVSNYVAGLAQASNRVHDAFAALKLPAVAPAATNYTVVADIVSMMNTALRDRVAKPDPGVIDGLRAYEELDRQLVACLQPFMDRQPRYAFPTVPERLMDVQETWKERRRRLRTMKETAVYAEFARLCDDLDKLYAACETVSNCPPAVGVLHGLVKATQKRLENGIGDGNAFDEKEVRAFLKRWSSLDEDCVVARTTILKLEADDFLKDYFMSAEKREYVSGYWQDLARSSLAILADVAGPELRNDRAALRAWARFPLDTDPARRGSLSPKELVQARQALDAYAKRYGLLEEGGEAPKKTIGKGDRCQVDWIDEQLDRLVCPEAEAQFAWLRKARKFAFALPDGVREFVEFRISLLPEAQQKTLMVECGKSMDDNACVVFENCYVSTKGNGELASRGRIGSGEPLVELGFPGDGTFTLYIYQYRDSTSVSDVPVACPGEPPWTLLNLLLDPFAKRDPDSPKKWYVPFRLKKGTRDVWLWLLVETGSRELPPREEWPQLPPE